MISRSAHSIRGRLSIHSRRAALAAAVALAAVTLTPAASHADTSSTVTVVGTSDVFDSGLIQNVIKPDFEAANPQYTLNYVSTGTGAAIAYAEAGTASALLVHAASLENQFVADGYSNEQYGRAIFYGDYVILGPASDPAGVMNGSQPSHDVVGAFEKIAAAGLGGTAEMVSRGGTPGTVVQEHQIWALTTGVPDLCDVSAANGGGQTPSTNPTAGPCASPTPTPSWYHATGLTQGPNVVAADTCDFGNGEDCYVMTDRGTYQFLQAEGALHNLQVVANDNSASAPGGADLLINSFHAYAINPAKFAGNSNVQLNLPGATAFLNWLTSEAGQEAVTAYQASFPGEGGGSSFIGDARPDMGTPTVPASVKSGKKLTVTGTLTNVVPGTPPLAGVGMRLRAKPSGATDWTTVATATTTASGKYTLSYTPTANASYKVLSDAISQIEVPSPILDPPFGDLLQSSSTGSLGKTSVTGAPVITKTSVSKGHVTVKGTLSPKVAGSDAILKLSAGKSTSSSQSLVSSQKLKNGAKNFEVKVDLRRGFKWKVSVKYLNSGIIAAGVSPTTTINVK